jgi:hypothetical protein
VYVCVFFGGVGEGFLRYREYLTGWPTVSWRKSALWSCLCYKLLILNLTLNCLMGYEDDVSLKKSYQQEMKSHWVSR